MTNTRFALLVLSAMAAGCGDSGSSTTTPMDMGTTSPSPDLVVTGPPPAPALGMQIDRMGRAGVNTALTDPFDIIPNKPIDTVKDAYNSDSDRSKWAANWATNIRTSLAILDGLDGVCGNQAAADASATRYALLAGALADDALVVDTTQTTCKQYLGVELTALAHTPADCGGRTPTENTIDITYSLLAIGAPAGVSNGITKKAANAPGDTFPFFAAPQQ